MRRSGARESSSMGQRDQRSVRRAAAVWAASASVLPGPTTQGPDVGGCSVPSEAEEARAAVVESRDGNFVPLMI